MSCDPSGTSARPDNDGGAGPLEELTVEEKVSLVVGMGFQADMPGLPAVDPADAAVPEKVPGAAGRTHAVPRLGIPSITLADGPAGVRISPTRDDVPDRTFHATAFPVATLLASSWDTDLVRDVGRAFGQEALEYGVDVLLAPGMNIHRNPLGGRNFEYYSEDPLLSGLMAAAFVNGVEERGVGTSIKHFAANNQEFNRMQSNTIVSERALREVYLRAFEIAVKESQPWTVMSAYNRVNGVYASESPELLTTILRDEWGFEGLVVTDWFAGADPVAQLAAGNDLLMPGTLDQTNRLLEAVESGALTLEELDQNVARILDVVRRSQTYRDYAYSDRPDLVGHATLARQAAAQGMVLLKNQNDALPLSPSATVALFGNAAYDIVIGGTGSGDVNEAYTVSLDAAIAEAGYGIDTGLQGEYRAYIADREAEREAPENPFFLPPPIPEMPVDADRAARAAGTADAAVITLGRNSGEFADRTLEGDFELTQTELSLIQHVANSFRGAGKPVVVVMNVAGVTEVASWRDAADAILLAWQPGQEGGHAMSDVLSGRVNPSGRLPATFPMRYSDVPSSENFPGRVLPGADELESEGIRGVPTEVVYDEGIYVGYRYYGTFDVAPAYPFGYGLSYTSFAYGDPTLGGPSPEGQLSIDVQVTNTGDLPGREVVQLYVRAPGRSMDKPARELKAFAKTATLEPGASETVSLTLSGRDLASYDSERSAWVAEAGTYTIMIGGSSIEERVRGSFELPAEIVVEQTNRVLVPEVEIPGPTAPVR